MNTNTGALAKLKQQISLTEVLNSNTAGYHFSLGQKDQPMVSFSCKEGETRPVTFDALREALTEIKDVSPASGEMLERLQSAVEDIQGGYGPDLTLETGY